MSRRDRPLLAVLALPLALAAAAAPAHGAGELVKNGAFSEGEGGAPADWQSQAWVKSESASRFTWERGPDGIGAIGIENLVPNDGAWTQSVPVSPSTWYRISGWVRAENVGEDHLGAYLSVMDTFFNTRELRGTQAWQQVAMWVKTGAIETSLRIGARLGGYASLNTGRAQFSMISVEAAGTPAGNEPFVYGGSPVDEERSRLPWMQGVAILVAAGVAFVLWRYLLPPARKDAAG
jgi:hypothetical protein